MAYIVTITETKVETKVERPGWTVVDRRPYTNKEVEEANDHWSSDRSSKTEVKDIFGYPPNREVEVETTREILKQRVEKLDLAKVIQAVNDL